MCLVIGCWASCLAVWVAYCRLDRVFCFFVYVVLLLVGGYLVFVGVCGLFGVAVNFDCVIAGCWFICYGGFWLRVCGGLTFLVGLVCLVVDCCALWICFVLVFVTGFDYVGLMGLLLFGFIWCDLVYDVIGCLVLTCGYLVWWLSVDVGCRGYCWGLVIVV